MTILDAAGNLTDAAVLACLAAVRHYRKPCTENSNTNDASVSPETPTMSDVIPRLLSANVKEPTPLPLHHTPLTISFALFAIHPDDDDEKDAGKQGRVTTASSTTTALLVDPTDREELCQTGHVTLALNAHREICLVDFSGGCEITVDDLRECHRQAVQHVTPLSQSLEQTLEGADQQALQQRLALLQQQQQQQVHLPPLPGADDTIRTVLPPMWDDVLQRRPLHYHHLPVCPFGNAWTSKSSRRTWMRI